MRKHVGVPVCAGTLMVEGGGGETGWLAPAPARRPSSRLESEETDREVAKSQTRERSQQAGRQPRSVP